MFLRCSLFASVLLGVTSQFDNNARTDRLPSNVISPVNDFQPRLFDNYRRNTWQQTGVVQNQPILSSHYQYFPAQSTHYEYSSAQSPLYQYSPYQSSPRQFTQPFFQISFPPQPHRDIGYERRPAVLNIFQSEVTNSNVKAFSGDDEASFNDFNEGIDPVPFDPVHEGSRSGSFPPQPPPQFQPQFSYEPQQAIVQYGGQQQYQSGATSELHLEPTTFQEQDELDEAIGVLPMSAAPMSGARGLLEYDQPNVVTNGAPWIIDVTGHKLQDILNSDKFWVVIFYTNWCEFTPLVAPFFRTLTNNFRGLVNAGAFDLDQDNHYKYLFNITDHPAVMFFFGDKMNPVIYPPRGSKLIRPREMGNLLAKLLFQEVADTSFNMKLGKWCFQRVNGECHAFE